MCSKVIQDEKLIECVRRHQVLYDTDAKEYNDNNFKLKIWRQIAKDCGLTSGDEAKRQWKNLRDGYRIALKMYKSNRVEPFKKNRQWKYFELMNFLRPYMRERNKIKVNPDNSDEADTCDDIFREYSAVKVEPTELLETSNFEESLQSDSGVPLKKLYLPAEMKNEQEDEWQREEICTQTELCPVSDDSLKLFFHSMYASTKQLPPALQRVVKNKLFQAVNEAEIEMEQIKDRD